MVLELPIGVDVIRWRLPGKDGEPRTIGHQHGTRECPEELHELAPRCVVVRRRDLGKRIVRQPQQLKSERGKEQAPV